MDILNTSQIPVAVETDVLVMGAGSAGCSAALAARETGNVRVTLIDKGSFPGGISTQALDTFYGFFTPGDEPKKVAGGIGDRVVDALDEVNAVFLRGNTYGAGTGVNYNPERLKLVWDQLLGAAGIHLLLHTQLVAVEKDGNKMISAVVFGKQGFARIQAKIYIDATGDADFCHLAGIPYETAGEDSPVQTMTTTFRMSNVDLELYEQAGGKKMLMQKMAEAVERRSHALPRKAGSIHPMNAEKCISTVAVRVAGFSGLDAAELTLAEQEGRRQSFIYEDFLRDCVPGFENSHIIGMSSSIGVRESRRVYGHYRLTREDCLSRQTFHDKVLICGAPIEDHRQSADGAEETHWAYVPDGGVYEVPLRCFLPEGNHQTLVCGRCFSATHDAHASCRSMGQTMAMGHACGVASAMSVRKGISPEDLAASDVQENLRIQGAVLELPAVTADISADGWSRNRRAAMNVR
ncbi:MAG: FAD-dependent oxidoreductase [Verrucomicrobiota bacterium]